MNGRVELREIKTVNRRSILNAPSILGVPKEGSLDRIMEQFLQKDGTGSAAYGSRGSSH